MAKIVFLYFTILATCAHSYSVNDALDQNLGPVQFVSIWYRHGERAPITAAPGFEVTYPSHWARGLGELTTQGLRGQYHLGQWLRNRYNHLIPPTGHLPYETVSIVSSDLHRCVQSALVNSAGMFPPSDDDLWGPMDWLPIPMTTKPDDVFNIPNTNCSKWSQDFEQVKASSDYAVAVEKYSPILAECQKIFNTTWGVKNPMYLAAFLWSLLPIGNLEALPMTEEERDFYRSLDEPNLASFKFQMQKESMRRLGGYPMIQWIVEDLTNARNNLTDEMTTKTPMKRFSIQSVKDTTLMGILNSLNVNFSSSPVPTSTLLFELRQAPNGMTYVTLLFRNTYDLSVPPKLLEVPDCSYPCTLTQFLSVTQKLIPDDWENECEQIQSTK